ncbi:terminase small subunit [Oceanicaulis sp.]|uniref:terminase small subunit n=1 Tax=Oceanicaulis sp. TaxID=1924941 RepID=UPI003D2CCE2C
MPRTHGGIEVNRAKVAEIFGVAVDTVSAWVKRGCPVLQIGRKGIQWKFNTADVSDWLVQDALRQATSPDGEDANAEAINIAVEKARREQYEADLAELRLRKERGELIELETIMSAVRSEYAVVRTRFGSLPGRLAAQLDPERAIELQPVIADQVDDILRELSVDDDLAAQLDGDGEGCDGAEVDPQLDAEANASPEPD